MLRAGHLALALEEDWFFSSQTMIACGSSFLSGFCEISSNSIVIVRVFFHNWTVEIMSVHWLSQLEDTTCEKISWFSILAYFSSVIFPELSVRDLCRGCINRGCTLTSQAFWRGKTDSVNTNGSVVPVDWGWQNWLAAEARENYWVPQKHALCLSWIWWQLLLPYFRTHLVTY